MLNYNILTLAEVEQRTDLKEELYKDVFEKTGNKINTNCQNDMAYAWTVMTKDNRYIMKRDTTIVDYEKGRAYSWRTINDKEAEELIKRYPDYAQYFEIKEKTSRKQVKKEDNE